MPARPITIRITRPALDPAGVARLGALWQAFEQRADASFFQSWIWVGCCVAERYDRPLLLEAVAGEALVGVALFNTRRRLGFKTLFLHESGRPAQDAVFIEHNGPLVLPDHGEVLGTMIRAAAAQGCVVLSGVGGAVRDAARAVAIVRERAVRVAPYVDLTALADAGAYAAQLSRNTRQRLRRSERAYAALGPLRIERADESNAMAWFEAMVVLHTRTWQARGAPGAFADPATRRFHAALIADGVPRGAVDLLRIAAGARTVGFLYNLRRAGRVCAYQSGFEYGVTDPAQTPGLTCHAMAIEHYRALGCRTYDFLAGESQYKRSLSQQQDTLVWLDAMPAWHPGALGAWLLRLPKTLPKTLAS